jgi:hypothetical protein
MSNKFYFLCVGSLFYTFMGASDGWASRKGDIIRRLNEQDRLEEGRSYCDKWLAVEEPVEDVRTYCADVFFRGVETTSSRSWEEFRTRWSGTEAAERARNPMVTQLLLDLKGEGSKEKYAELEELALDPDLKKECYSAGVKSALQKVSSPSEAKALAMELKGQEEVFVLFERFPEVFFSVQVQGSAIDVQKNIELPVDEPKAVWARRCGEEKAVAWDKVVKGALIAEGIPNSQIMNKIQVSTNKSTSFPLCPLFGQDPSCVLGVSLEVRNYHAFLPQGWSTECDVDPVLMSFTKRRLRSMSIGDGHLVELLNPLYNKEKLKGNTPSFTKLKKKPYLFEGNLYSAHNNAFLVYPIDGNPPFLSEKPPGTWKIMMGKKVKGAPVPQKWSVDTRDGIQVDMGADSERELPSGELRVFSPQASQILGLNTIEPVSLTEPTIEWNRQKPPRGVVSVDVDVLEASGINNASTQLFAAGFNASDIEVYDGWLLDLDGDGDQERVLRLSINAQETLAVLDYEKDIGPKTYLFQSDHAIHGSTRAPVPRAFEQDGKTVLYWSGREGQLRYLEWVFPLGTGYEMGHKDF